MVPIELWDVLNKQGDKTGKTVVRGEKLRLGQYHLVVHIWIVDSSGRLLIQRRAPHLALMPGQWAATGGSALHGEDSEDAARRELAEELGIRTEAGEMEKITRLVRHNSLADIWLLRRDIPIEDLVLQKEEVADARWVTTVYLRDMIKNHTYHNYGRQYFDLLFRHIFGETLERSSS